MGSGFGTQGRSKPVSGRHAKRLYTQHFFLCDAYDLNPGRARAQHEDAEDAARHSLSACILRTTRLPGRRYVGSERDATAFYAGSMTAFFLSRGPALNRDGEGVFSSGPGEPCQPRLGILTLAVWLVLWPRGRLGHEGKRACVRACRWALNENIDFSDVTFGDAESARTPSSQRLHLLVACS